MNKIFLLIIIICTILVCGFSYALLKSRSTTIYPYTPTRYDAVLECQKLSAQTIDKFREEMRDDKKVKVVFTYEDCKKELFKVLDENKILKI